jgi:hypothetical protein
VALHLAKYFRPGYQWKILAGYFPVDIEPGFKWLIAKLKNHVAVYICNQGRD